jgi:hypothetical protein
MRRRQFLKAVGGCTGAVEAMRFGMNPRTSFALAADAVHETAGGLPVDFTLNATPAASVSLDGQWQIARDPENSGKGAHWFEGGPVEGALPAEIPNPLELTYPGYDGVVWYWRSFDADDLVKYEDVRIHFQGADYFAEAWLNGQYLGGNESALLPFAFPIQQALHPGANRLVVRVIDACYSKEIDGFQLGHVPGGRQADDPLQRGWRHYNYGGLLLPVSVQAFRRPWIGDGFIRPAIKEGKIDIDLTVVGGAQAEWVAEIRPAHPQSGKVVVQSTVLIAPDASGKAHITLPLPTARLWKIWDSFLYEVMLSPKQGPEAGTTWRQRFGMREISILNGRIAVNGEPILQRSFLYNQIWPVTLGVPYRDLARRDIELARRANANMLRCFSKTPVPATVEAADEIGILLQAESLGSWYLERGEKEQARLKNITERAVLLYRNHPSIVWWTMLNENAPTERSFNTDVMLLGPYALSAILPSVHALDPTRPCNANDPVWQDVPNIWEPGHSQPSLPFVQEHYYQFTSLENHEDSWLRIRGRSWGDKPNPGARFLGVTEWGQNSSPDWDRLIQSYKSAGVREDAEDYEVYRKLLDMSRSWYERSDVAKQGFPTFESLGEAHRASVAQRYREHFALYWGNVHCVGHGLTSLEDSSYELSGIVDNWRNPKPMVFDVLSELNRPLQVNLWLRPSCVYANDTVTFDATLVNEGRKIAPGDYRLLLKVVDGQDRVVHQKDYHQKIVGDPIEFLMAESAPLAVSAGLYRLELELLAGGNNLKGGQPVQVFERESQSLGMTRTVWVWDDREQLQKWLQKRGASARKGDFGQIRRGDLALVLGVPDRGDTVKRLQAAVRQGVRAVILRPESVFTARSEDEVPSLSYSSLLEPISGEWKPELRLIDWWGSPGAWGYSRAALALQHSFLEGLPQAVALEAQPAYQRVAPRYTWVMTGQPALVHAERAVVEFSLGVDAPYTSDLFSLSWGQGTLVLNTLHLAEYLDVDPAADRILENIIRTLARQAVDS